MQLNDLKQIMAEVFEIHEEEIVEDLKLNDIPQWDSVNHLNLMLYFEREKGLEINEENIIKCTSVQGILEFFPGT